MNGRQSEMRVRLKGINRVRKKLASGEVKEFYYAWKGGPPLVGKPGSPEFIASYNAAVEAKRPVKTGEMQSILDAFQDSSDFRGLAPRTQADYRKILKAIGTKYGDFPLAAFSDRKTRGEFLEWRDGLIKGCA